MANQKTNSTAEPPVPCPKCGKVPETIKTGSYWLTRCTTQHMVSVTGHPMKTKGAAIHEWNNAHGKKE